MAITLVGEVVNDCDSATGWLQGGVDTDIYIEPTGSIGQKSSNTTTMFLGSSLGASAPYNFNTGGGQEGYHIIMWFNGLTPLASSTGMRIAAGSSSANYGHWNVGPPDGYTGGFVPQVINTAAQFDHVFGTFTTSGNPGQLTAVSNMGGVLQTTSSIMGNFNNILIDQVTVGLGVRADAGTSGTPNTFATVVSGDNTNKWGWWISASGSFVARGKLYIGPATGTASSYFVDTGAVVVFASARVANGFYELHARGSGTTFTLDGCVLRAENPSIARWSLTIDGTSVPTFTDSGSLFKGFNTLTLRSSSTLTGTKLDSGLKVYQNSATLTGLDIVNQSTSSGVALIESNAPANISSCTFNLGAGVGHAIEITTPGTYSFFGNVFTGYGANDSNNAAIYNNSGGAVTLNVTGGGSTPTIRNGSGASTTIIAGAVSTTVKTINISGSNVQSAQVFVKADAGGPFPSDVTVTIANSGTTATVTHASHGLATNDKVLIKGAPSDTHHANNGVFTITVTDANTYTYVMGSAPGSSPTGTIKSTFVALYGSTNASGEITMSRVFSSNQPISGWARKSTSSPYYKTTAIAGTVNSATGYNATVQLLPDE